MQKVVRRLHPISYEELMDVLNIWVDTALQLDDKDLRVMERLLVDQEKRLGPGGFKGQTQASSG